MAAATLAASRGVTGSSSIRGLFLMFTVLCLACLSSAFIDKNTLEELRENYQKAKQQMDKLKVDYDESLGFTNMMGEYMNFMDPFIAMMKKIEERSADDDFPPLNSFMESVKHYMERTKTYIDRKHKDFGEDIKESEKKLDKMKKYIDLFEEQQAEL